MKSMRHFTIACWLLLSAWGVALAGPVSWYGQLTTSGNKIMNSGKTLEVQLKGASLFWSSAKGRSYYNQKSLNWLVDTMGISVVRAAMAVEYWDSDGGASSPVYLAGSDFGYLSASYPNAKALQKGYIDSVVQAAIVNDVYVIIDWHSHRAHESTEQSEAVAFFAEMAGKYKDVPNVIWEIYNEPVYADWGSQIYPYADAVIAAIRGAGSSQLIIVGSQNWSQYPNSWINDNLDDLHSKTYNGMTGNIAYSLHFYAGSHSSTSIGPNADAARSASNPAPVFVTEWGVTDADGDDGIDAAEVKVWTDWMDARKISSCNWSVSASGDRTTTSSLWPNGKTLSLADTTVSGNIFYQYMQANAAPPTGYPWGKSRTFNMNEGETKEFTLADLGAINGGSGTVVFAGVGTPSVGTASYTAGKITYTAPTVSTQGMVTFNYTLTNGSHTSKHRLTALVNRRPVMTNPDTVIATSYKTSSLLTLSAMGIKDADGNTMKITAASTTAGTATVSAAGDNVVYVPLANYLGTAASKEASLNVTVSDGVQTATFTVTLLVRHFAPVASADISYYFVQNTSVLVLTTGRAGASDRDGDALVFTQAAMVGNYPGTITYSAAMDTLYYTPEANKIGTVQLTYQVKDSEDSLSGTGLVEVEIRGTGTQIPVYVPSAVLASVRAVNAMTLQGSVLRVECATAGYGRIDAYGLDGRHLGTLFRGRLAQGQNALDASRLPQGQSAVLRLQKGAESAVLRYVPSVR